MPISRFLPSFFDGDEFSGYTFRFRTPKYASEFEHGFGSVIRYEVQPVFRDSNLKLAIWINYLKYDKKILDMREILGHVKVFWNQT